VPDGQFGLLTGERALILPPVGGITLSDQQRLTRAVRAVSDDGILKLVVSVLAVDGPAHWLNTYPLATVTVALIDVPAK
jgi:hypothetical protein